MEQQALRARSDFRHLEPVGTRWADNDMYGHLNNAVYYQLFDTAINAYVVRRTGVLPPDCAYLAVTAQNGCRFHRELRFPQRLEVGLRVARLGRSSVTYDLGLFEEGREESSATGSWVHVYVDRERQVPTPIPEDVRAVLAEIA